MTVGSSSGIMVVMTDRGSTIRSMALGVAGVLLYLAAGWLYLGSGLVMPYPFVYGMWALWLGGWAVVVRVFRRSRPWTPTVAAGAVAVWIVVVQSGSWLFGWTA